MGSKLTNMGKHLVWLYVVKNNISIYISCLCIFQFVNLF